MIRKRPLSAEQFKEIYSKVTRLCVDLLIESDQGYLLTYRTKNGYLNQWHMPGGTVLYREKISETIKRVSQEELGVPVVINKQLGIIEYFSEIYERGYGYTISLVYLCKLPDKTTIKLDDQVEKFDFFEKLPSNTVKEQIDFIENYQKQTQRA